MPGSSPQTFWRACLTRTSRLAGVAGWSDPGGHGVFSVAELPSGRIVGLASGGPRREKVSRIRGRTLRCLPAPGAPAQGVGRQLLGAVAGALAAEGRRSMLTLVLARNPSRPFYEAVGGEQLGSQEIEMIEVIALEEVAYGWDDIRSLTVSH
jgi:Acetyltransferase (GNAT) family